MNKFKEAIIVFQLLIMIFFFSYPTEAQLMERFTFDIGGGYKITDNHQVHYSFGQPFTETIVQDEFIISEGFIQGQVMEMSTPTYEWNGHLQLTVNPNPSFDLLKIAASRYLPTSTLIFYTLEGRKMIELPFIQEIEFDLSSFSAGIYILQWVNQDHQLLRKFKVVKL